MSTKKNRGNGKLQACTGYLREAEILEQKSKGERVSLDKPGKEVCQAKRAASASFKTKRCLVLLQWAKQGGRRIPGDKR